MSRRQHPGKNLLLVTLLLLLATMGMAPVGAQYSPYSSYSYSPLTGSTNMFWPLRLLVSPGSMLWRGGYGYSAPYYLANTLTYNAAYAAGMGVNALGRQNYMNYYWNQNNGINAPVVDQISMAPWYYPPRGVRQAGTALANSVDNTSSRAINNPIMPTNTKSNEFMPVPVALSDASTGAKPAETPSLSLNQSASPTIATAPDFRSGKTVAAAASAATAPTGAKISSASENGAGASNPFAQAFIDHVNNKFSGDISKALSDKQTRGYAQALGILEHESKDVDIPADRIELIKRIMQDPAEDSLTKVNTIRLLIKH